MVVTVDEYILLKEYYLQNHHRKRCLQSEDLKVEPYFNRFIFVSSVVALDDDEINFLKDNNLIHFGGFDKSKLKVTKAYGRRIPTFHNNLHTTRNICCLRPIS